MTDGRDTDGGDTDGRDTDGRDTGAGDVVVYSVSDHTGLTAEAFAHSLVSQFDGIDATYLTRAFVDTPEKVDALIAEIDDMAAGPRRPLVFCTFASPEVQGRLEQSEALVVGLFDHAIDRVAQELGSKPSGRIGGYHGIRDAAAYELRLAAVDFSLMTDDGLGIEHYSRADVVLVGVSRVGKTPTCIHLSMQYGIRAANYPMSPDDHSGDGLPETLRRYRGRIYGLTIEPHRLSAIRMQRRPGSPYASIEVCRREIAYAEAMFRSEAIPYLDTTSRSIEEITATIIDEAGLTRRVS